MDNQKLIQQIKQTITETLQKEQTLWEIWNEKEQQAKTIKESQQATQQQLQHTRAIITLEQLQNKILQLEQQQIHNEWNNQNITFETLKQLRPTKK